MEPTKIKARIRELRGWCAEINTHLKEGRDVSPALLKKRDKFVAEEEKLKLKLAQAYEAGA